MRTRTIMSTGTTALLVFLLAATPALAQKSLVSVKTGPL